MIMKPTQEQVIAWARDAGAVYYSPEPLRAVRGMSLTFEQLEAAYSLAYEAGRKDENEACDEAIKDLWGAHPIDYEDVLYAIRARREQ